MLYQTRLSSLVGIILTATGPGPAVFIHPWGSNAVTRSPVFPARLALRLRVGARAKLYLVFILSAAIAGCGQRAAEAPVRYHQAQAVMPQIVDQFEAVRSLPGRVEAPQRADIGFTDGGKIVALVVEEGDRVNAGQLLASVDTQLLDAERDSVLAQADELAARLKLVELDLQRQRTLKQQGYSAEQQIDELSAERAALKAQQARNRASLALVEQRLDRARLKAPFGGRVVTRFVDTGAVVSAGAPVLRLLEDGDYEFHVGVPVQLSRQLRVGEQLDVEVEHHRVQSTLLAVNAAVSPSTQTVIARLGLPAEVAGMVLLDGQIARLQLRETRKIRGAWLPLDALLGGIKGTWNVMALNEHDAEAGLFMISREKVHIEYVDKGRAFVRGELHEGLPVVAGGVHRLAAGQLVRVAMDKGDTVE